MIKFNPYRELCAGLVVLGLSVSAMATEPSSTGLGQSWPDAQDVSTSTHWHVYTFNSNGVQYVQVNDLNGNVRVAFAAADGQFLVLPMGRNAQNISTPQQAAIVSETAVPLNSYGETVYRDNGVQLDVVPMSDGTTVFKAASSATNATIAPCDDPEECNKHVQ